VAAAPREPDLLLSPRILTATEFMQAQGQATLEIDSTPPESLFSNHC
jgi:hypothetical protein